MFDNTVKKSNLVAMENIILKQLKQSYNRIEKSVDTMGPKCIDIPSGRSKIL